MKKNLFILSSISILIGLCIPEVLLSQNTSPYWSLAGNNNATATSKLGTTNDVSLRFYTNNVQRMIINSANGFVGIGTADPVNALTVKVSGGTPAASWLSGSNSPAFVAFAENISASFNLATASNLPNVRPVFNTRRSRGTLALPAAVASNDFLASFVGSGYDGTAFQNPASIDMYVDGVPSAGNVPARISLVTGSNGGNRTERLRVGSTGNFNFNNGQLFLQQSNGYVGIGTTTPVSKLHVAGSILSDDVIHGRTSATNGYGLFGESGLHGDKADPPFGYGVYGLSRYDYGVYGVSQDGTGVYGEGNEYGVIASSEFTAVHATGGTIGITAEGSAFGITSVASIGVQAAGYFGIVGTTDSGFAVEGLSTTGFAGFFDSEAGTGLLARTTSGTYAGVFQGDVYTSGAYLPSDKNLKENIQDFSSAMSIINKLEPKYYQYKTDAKFASLSLPKGNHYGLIAQDVEQVLPGLVKESSHIAGTKFQQATKSFTKENALNDALEKQNEAIKALREGITIKAINYTELIPIVIRGMQEMDTENKELKEENNAIKQELAELRKMILELKGGVTEVNADTKGFLEQNNPNPVSGNTIIRYTIPGNSASAKITVTDVKGQLIKMLTITQTGAGQLNFNTSTLAAGTYNYILWINGKQADTKRMIITK